MMMMSRAANGRMRMRSPTLLIQGHMLEDRFVIIIITMFAIIIINIIITLVCHCHHQFHYGSHSHSHRPWSLHFLRQTNLNDKTFDNNKKIIIRLVTRYWINIVGAVPGVGLQGLQTESGEFQLRSTWQNSTLDKKDGIVIFFIFSSIHHTLTYLMCC